MTSQDTLLGKLLNDDSFINWVRGEASSSQEQKWDEWLLEDSKNQELVKKAQKIVSMPFAEYPTLYDKSMELHRLEKAVSEAEKGDLESE